MQGGRLLKINPSGAARMIAIDVRQGGPKSRRVLIHSQILHTPPPSPRAWRVQRGSRYHTLRAGLRAPVASGAPL